jgi:hypothetical protein
VDDDEIQEGPSHLDIYQACRIEIAIDSSGSAIIMPDSHHDSERISMAAPRMRSRELLKLIARGSIEQHAHTKRVKEGSEGMGIQTMQRIKRKPICHPQGSTFLLLSVPPEHFFVTVP